MAKTFILGIIFSLFLSCKGDGEKVAATDTSAYDISTEKWSKRTNLNAKAMNIVSDWPEFKALEVSFDALYNVGNTEDLTLILEDLIEKQKALAKSTYPEVFDKPQIKSRQKVFHTFVLKTKGDLIYSIDSQESVTQMIAAYNKMLDYMNSITSNTLDLKSILEEENDKNVE